MKTFYYTFGFSHEHPTTGESLSRKFIKIEAEDSTIARLKMVSTFGTNWAMEYTEDQFLPQIGKYKLTEIKE